LVKEIKDCLFYIRKSENRARILLSFFGHSRMLWTKSEKKEKGKRNGEKNGESEAKGHSEIE